MKRSRLFLFLAYGTLIVLGAFYLISRGVPGTFGRFPPSDQGPHSAAALNPRAEAVVVIDAGSGQILIADRAHVSLPMGPLVRMLAALVIAENRDADEPVLVSWRAAAQPGTRLGLAHGATLDAGSLLRALWFVGARDAELALIEHVAGSEAAFARQMAEAALRYGALQTRVALPARGAAWSPVSTAYDAALLARAVLQDPLLSSIAGQRRVTLDWTDGRRELLHINSFLWQYPGATGIMSGYTEDAGFAAAASAKRGTRHLIAVVLGAPSGPERRQTLFEALDYAFRRYGELVDSPLADAVPYDVLEGDTLLRIAQKTGVPVEMIREWNQIPDPNRLQAGTRLWLPVGPAAVHGVE